MRFHVPAAACQLSSRPLLAGQSSSRGAADKVKYSAARSHLACRPAGLFSLTLLLLLSHLAGSGAGGGGASSRRLGSQGGAPTALSGHLCHSESGPDLDPQTVARLLESLVTVPHDEVGEVALCASLRNEGRFIVEWLLYVSSRVYSRWLRGRRRAGGTTRACTNGQGNRGPIPEIAATDLLCTMARTVSRSRCRPVLPVRFP